MLQYTDNSHMDFINIILRPNEYNREYNKEEQQLNGRKQSIGFE